MTFITMQVEITSTSNMSNDTLVITHISYDFYQDIHVY